MDAAIASYEFARAYLSARRHKPTGAVEIPIVLDRDNNLAGVGRPSEWKEGVAEMVMRKKFRVEYLETLDCYNILKQTRGITIFANEDCSGQGASEPEGPAPEAAPSTESRVTRQRSYTLFDRMQTGSCASQGSSAYMEDEVAILKQLGGTSQSSFFGVYDGHGGVGAARYAQHHLHEILLQSDELLEDPAQALRDTFQETDRRFIAGITAPGVPREPKPDSASSSGTTAVCVLVRGDEVTIANLGDCRVVLSHGGEARDLSEDQKPTLTREQERIVQEGGHVVHGRLNGDLAVSRALGDYVYEVGAKPAGLTAVPEVSEHHIVPGDEFILIASDGLWDVMKSKEAVKFARAQLAEHGDLDKACERLCNEAVTNKYSTDNVSVVMCSFMSDEKLEELKKVATKAKGAYIPPWKRKALSAGQLKGSMPPPDC